MTTIISVFNQSGGVGKTTITHNLSYHLAVKEQKVLAIDLDPQASLTSFMGLTPQDLTETVYRSLVDNVPLPRHSKIHHVNLDLVPASIQLSAAEKQLVTLVMRELRLKNAIVPFLKEYDFILIDCPPSLGILSILSLVASTHVLVPIQTQSKAFEGTDLLLKTVSEIRQLANPTLNFAGFIPTIYDRRTSHQYQVNQSIGEQLSALATVYAPLPYTTVFPDASQRRLPLALYRPSHPAVVTLCSIAEGLMKL
ncbi:ParA family protein [Chroococcus sp. FPU101]|uniref:ParA family protein n=1 Tax=Chroococcus sp. FPU101 TaxID=1974212 RepID=UPI001A8C2B64|nr:ParA family protein [Chroococcus sp. FPU101]GFE72204.1 Cobyrinic acid ac-diamide synthase [Chroococcus sp. FPU101]